MFRKIQQAKKILKASCGFICVNRSMFGQIISKDLNKNIEFIPYTSQYYDQTIEVVRQAFFKNETTCIGCQIDTNVNAQKDLERLCDDIFKRSTLSIIARDVELDKIVGAVINGIQVRNYI